MLMLPLVRGVLKENAFKLVFRRFVPEGRFGLKGDPIPDGMLVAPTINDDKKALRFRLLFI
jgi:hypothetical protein